MFRRRTRLPTIHNVAEVFGIQREVPLNYVPRTSVDDVFVDSLTRKKHVVIYGSSKQGKTSLRKYSLKSDEYITVTCSNTANLSQLLSSILKEAGYTVIQSSTRTASGESKISVTAGAGVTAGIFRASANAGRDITQGDATTQTEVSLELDPSDVNDIIRALDEINFKQFIVLEDFHYLPSETQKEFSVALKAFHENSSLTFIIVGVWLDRNRLIQLNGDLTGRVLSVDADAWSKDELKDVISTGEKLLNITFDPTVVDQLVDGCSESVYIVQEACYRICIDEHIVETQTTSRQIGTGTNVSDRIIAIVDEQAARYDTFIAKVAAGFQQTQLEMYRWILLPVLLASPELLQEGVPWETIKQLINANHPEAPINSGNVIQALGSLSSLQVKANITPIVLDYDETRKRLNVVDRGFGLWRKSQALSSLLESVDLPSAPVVPSGLGM
jgi:hypothetical protein